MSTITMPSDWKLVEIANESPNVSMAQERISKADALSKSLWPPDGTRLTFHFSNQDHRHRRIAGLHIQHPVVFAFLAEARKTLGSRVPNAQHRRMRRAGCLLAHGHEGVEVRRAGEVFVIGCWDHGEKIPLRRGSDVVAIDRLQGVAQSVNAGLDRLPAPVGALGGKPNGAHQCPVR